MHDKFECRMKHSWTILMRSPVIYLERTKKSTKTLSQDSRLPDRDLNPGYSECEAG
jgi:hypothetical protein